MTVARGSLASERPADTEVVGSAAGQVPPAGLEPAPLAPEASALSAELRGPVSQLYHRAAIAARWERPGSLGCRGATRAAIQQAFKGLDIR